MRYTVGAAARATGVNESRLRTWERRYGIPSPDRSGTGRRLYDDDDLEVITRMAALIDSGVPAAQAAEAIHAGTAPDVPRGEQIEPEVDRRIPALVAAAGAFDAIAARAQIQSAVSDLGWGEAMDRVLFPAMLEVGRGWEAGALTVAHEHFLTELVRLEMFHAIALSPDPPTAKPVVVLACPEAEHHDVGLIGLWLLLRQEGVPAHFLGANVPQHALIDMVRTLAPAAVCLASTVQPSLPGLAQAARALLRIRPAPHVFVGGPAVHDNDAPRSLGGVRLPVRITDAARAVIDALEHAA